jgi:hypothetical protein
MPFIDYDIPDREKGNADPIFYSLPMRTLRKTLSEKKKPACAGFF